MLEIIFDAKSKMFIAAEGAKIFEHRYVSGDDWHCRINEDGSVRCIATEPRNNQYFEISIKVSNKGLVRVSKVSGRIRRDIRRFRVRNWPVVGVFSLTGGPIEERNAFFNDIKDYKAYPKNKEET